MKRTAVIRDWNAPLSRMKAESRGETAFSASYPLLEEGRPAAIWRRLFYRTLDPARDDVELLGQLRGLKPYPGGHDAVCAALGLSLESEEDEAPRRVLSYFGVTASKIMPGPKQWTFPASKEEGTPAVIVPVGWCGVMHLTGLTASCLALLGAHELAREAELGEIGDLIAIPLEGTHPLSFNGTTAAIGSFKPNAAGDLRLASDGLNWLKRHIGRARKAAAEMPAHLVARTLAFPDHSETLLIDAKAFAWRLENPRYPIAAGTKQVKCPDSAELADLIATELKKREKLPPAPQVLGPKA